MKNLIIAFNRLILFAFLSVTIWSCTSPASESTADKQEESTQIAHQTHLVEITQMKFNPEVVTVKIGDKITFVNHDMVAHDITEESSKKWSSSPLQPEQTWTLDVTESNNYYCSLHPVMKGKIIVE